MGAGQGWPAHSSHRPAPTRPFYAPKAGTSWPRAMKVTASQPRDPRQRATPGSTTTAMKVASSRARMAATMKKATVSGCISGPSVAVSEQPHQQAQEQQQGEEPPAPAQPGVATQRLSRQWSRASTSARRAGPVTERAKDSRKKGPAADP